MPLISAAGWKSACNRRVTQTAEYFDGRTATRHEVTLHFDTSGLRITGIAVDEIWAYADIHYAGEYPDDLPQTFRRHAAGVDGARLRVGDQAIVDTLRLHCPDLENRAHRARQRRQGLFLGSVGVVSLCLAVWGAIHFFPRLVAPMLPVAWEEKLGDGVVSDIMGIFGAMSDGKTRQCETADGRLALDMLVGQLVRQVETPYRFKVVVLDIDMVNALAAPGGRIVIFRKLLTEANSPDEVAGVLAHEMGHVIARHPTESVARAMGISLVFNVLMGGLGSGAAGAAGQALISSAYSRDAEREADNIGLNILSGAGISPKGVADFFDRMAKSEGDSSRALSFISSHPPSEERAQAARLATDTNTRPALSQQNWEALLTICGNE